VRAVCLAVAALSLTACKVKDPPPITGVYTDTFDRDTLGEDYLATGDGYTVTNGALSAKGAHNHPMWLRARLPRDVRIEFDCWSTEKRGDIKVEVFGDGKSYDPDGGAYTAVGYEVIMGGWFNSKSIIARLNEHGEVGKDVFQRADVKVVPNKHYHWRIERVDKVLTWYVDDMTKPFLTFDDPHPLEGGGHEYFAFNNWETDTWFDNLSITPL
jgi:hypothetical protein